MENNSKIKNVRLEASDNGGFVLKYSVITPSKNGDKYSPMDYDDKTETFGKGEHDMAITRMNELTGQKPEEEKEEEPEQEEEKSEEAIEEEPTAMGGEDVILPHEQEE